MANVTESEMQAYLETFHDEYRRTVEAGIPAELRGHLLRYSLLPCAVIGYVSTNFGAGYEYREGDDNITVERGSRRVEELFVGAPNWLNGTRPIISVEGRETGISQLTLDGGFPFGLASRDADITFFEVRFQAGPWQRDVLYAQFFGDRRSEAWTEAVAVRRAKDEVLAALVDVRLKDTRDVDFETYLQTFKQRTVLVLGDFNQGRDRLGEIRQTLNGLGYQPILLDEIPEVPHYDLRQKFQAVAPVCRFLVFEDSTPAGHILELGLAEQLKSIVIVLRQRSARSTFMTAGYDLTSTVVREWEYEAATLEDTIREAVAWAEQRVSELASQRDVLYPWRDQAAEGS